MRALGAIRSQHADSLRMRVLFAPIYSPEPAAPERMPGFPEVVVRARGVRVSVYATHLDDRAHPRIRERQVHEALRIRTADRPGTPQVLAGDLNATPEADELAPLWGHLTDVWTVVGDGRGLTYPSSRPTKRIDHVTVSPAVTPVEARVPATRASDHLPVVADLAVHRP